MASDEVFSGVCNKIAAGWWTRLFARLFGQKVATIDDWGGLRCIVVAYRWRGVLYVADIRYEPLPQSAAGEGSK